MDNNGYVIGLGLPRTGGTTLAEALRALGYHGKNSCIVTNVTTTTESTIVDGNNKKFLIDNEIPAIFMNESWNRFSELYNVDANTKFILTTRSEKTWLSSLAKFDHKSVRGTAIPLKNEYEDLVKEVIKPKNLLVINWTKCKKKCWKQLCNFLDEPHKPLEGKDFPCENC